MNSIHSEFLPPQDLYDRFIYDSDKFEKRYESILTDINNFIEKSDLQEKVKVNGMLLGYALFDYFSDIMRLKDFHKLEHVNGVKVVAYTSYWLLKRKPIQVEEPDKNLLYINERFVLIYILDFLCSDSSGSLLECDKSGLVSFAETLFYSLKYRNLGPNSIEMIIMSFLAGRIYQEKEQDLSNIIGKY